MKRNLVEIKFKHGRPEPIVVDRNQKVLSFGPGLMVVNNLRGDSLGHGKGRRLVRLSDISSMRRVSGVA